MKLRWLLWWGCILLAVGSAVGAWATLDQRAYATRGWVDATQTLDLPYRLPLTGVNVELAQYRPDELESQLDRIAAAGFTWVRQPFLWQDIEPEQGQYTWETYDEIVAAVQAHDSLKLVVVLDGTPPWARHTLAPDHPFAPPASVGDYGNFARAVAERYGESIDFYQIWDEPNIRLHWGNLDPRPAHYVAMLREAYTAIHAADPVASVIMAALAPTVEDGPENLSEMIFLRAVYDLDGEPYFDAAAGKPYGFDNGPYDRRVDEGVMNFSRLILMREEMVRRGDGDKPLWGSNFGWNSLPDGWTGPPSIWGSATAEQRDEYTRDAYQRAQTEWPWVGGLILQHWQPDAPADDPIQGFAVAPVIDDWTAKDVLPTPHGLIPGLYPAQNAYTTYSENWRFSGLGADADIPAPGVDVDSVRNWITVQFAGTSLAITTRRDDYLAYLTVTIDRNPANALPQDRHGEAFIILTSPERTPVVSQIVVARDLKDTRHTAEIVHQPNHGDDRWPIAGFAVGTPPDTENYRRGLIACAVIGGLAVLGAVIITMRLPWRNVKAPALPTVRQGIEWLLSLLASVVVLLGTLATWGETIPSLLRRDQPALAITVVTAGIASLSPVAVITLAALGVLFILIYNRPLLGLMLIIFWSAFFLSTLDLLFSAFATVEVYFLLTAAALIARVMVAWAQQRQDGTGLNWPIRFNALDKLVMVFVALAVISLAWAEYWPQATRELRVVILEPATFYFMIRLMKLERRDLLWLVDALLFTGVAIAVVGLYRYALGESVVEAENGARRLMSVYGSPNGVGLYLGRCLPFALGFVLIWPRGSWRWLYGVGSGAVMLLAVLLSQSRGAILLGLPAALVMVLIMWRGRRALIPVTIAVVGVVIVLIPLSLALPRLGDLFGDTLAFRRHLWYSSVQLIEERPITGVGLDQFLYVYRSRYLLPEAWEEPNLSIPHNVLLNYWVNLGIFGVVIGIALQGMFWRLVWKVRQRATADPLVFVLVIGIAGSMADLLGHGLVDVGYFAVNLAFVFFLLLALLQRLDQYQRTMV